MLSKLLWQSAPKPSQSASLIEGSQPRESIYLISMASFPNFGDELIAARWLRFLAQHRPEADIWLDVREPGTATSLFKGLHPRLHVTNTLFRAIHEHVTGGNRTPAELVAELGSPKFDAGLVDFRQADTVHLLGGGFINAIWPHNGLLVDAMRAAREISGAHLFATGQGLMPRITEDFSDFDYVSVRDQPSAEALGINREYDDAYLIESTPERSTMAPLPEELELYLCLQNDALDQGAHDALVTFAQQQIEKLGIPRERTFYVEAIPGDDYAGYLALKDYVSPDGGFVPFEHFWRSNFEFRPNQVWLSTRFHHHLVGSMNGARGIALSGKVGYYDVKHGSLTDTGTRWKVPADLSCTYTLEDLEVPESCDPQVTAKKAEALALYPSA